MSVAEGRSMFEGRRTTEEPSKVKNEPGDQPSQAKKPTETDDANSSEETMKGELAELRLDRLVDRIARELKITDEDDLELIKAAREEGAMRKLATRLAGQQSAVRRPPRQDTSQGKGGHPTTQRSLSAGREMFTSSRSKHNNSADV